MKNFAPFTQDGFPFCLETIQFLRDIDDDQYKCLVALIGTNTIFITGGLITTVGGNTTITPGIIYKDGKFYAFTGGTFVGAPSALKILFDTQLADGYPQSLFENDPIVKNIYLANTATVDAAGTITLTSIGYSYDFQSIKQKIDTLRVDVDALNNKTSTSYSLTGVGSGSTGNVSISRCGNVVTISGSYTQGSVASTTGINLIVNNTITALSGFPIDTRWIACPTYSSVNPTTLLTINPTIKQIGILIGNGSLTVTLGTTMSANTTVYFSATFILHP